jgi:Tol biopolymer transport system component
MTGRTMLRLLALLGLAVLVAAACEVPQPWRREQITVDPAGTAGGNADTRVLGQRSGSIVFLPSAVSADGSTIAFATAATNLASGASDDPAFDDVYVRDLDVGVTTLVSAAPGGTTGGNGTSDPPAISPDGSKVAFASLATNLGLPANGILRRVYVRDLTTGTTSLVSVKGDGTDDPNNGAALQPVFSPDGTKVAFNTTAFDMGPVDNNGPFGVDTYVRDVAASTTSLVSVNSAGTEAAPGAGVLLEPAVWSADGTQIAFTSKAGDLVPGVPPLPDTNLSGRLYVRDLVAGHTTLASPVDATSGIVDDAHFSPDGTKVVYTLRLDGRSDVFMHDLTTDETTRLTDNAAGTAPANGLSRAPRFGGDDTHVVFESEASDLGPTDTNGVADIYIRDLTAGSNALVSVNAAGTAPADAGGTAPSFSPDGRRVAFVSAATDLGPPPADGTDIYVRDLVTGTTSRVTQRDPAVRGGPVSVANPQFTPTGALVFASSDSDLGPASAGGHVQYYRATFFGADLQPAIEVRRSARDVGIDVTVRNDGPDTAEDADVLVHVPGGVDVVTPLPGGCTFADAPPSPDLVECDLGDLGAGASRFVQLTATVSAPAGTDLFVQALARSATVDPVPTGNQVGAHIPN